MYELYFNRLNLFFRKSGACRMFCFSFNGISFFLLCFPIVVQLLGLAKTWEVAKPWQSCQPCAVAGNLGELGIHLGQTWCELGLTWNQLGANLWPNLVQWCSWQPLDNCQTFGSGQPLDNGALPNPWKVGQLPTLEQLPTLGQWGN